jgi:hypothetical protein
VAAKSFDFLELKLDIMGRPLSTALVVAWNIVAVVALLAGVEFTARMIQCHRIGGDIRQSIELRDRYAVWRNNPSFHDAFARHNREGFRRDEDTPLEKAPNNVRVFVLGASTAYGAGSLYPDVEGTPPQPRNDQTISYYLGKELNARFPSRRWEVVNAAVPAHRLHQELALLLSRVLRYHPDYVICIDGVNDMRAILNAAENYDPYRIDDRQVEFDLLANPASFASLKAFASVWLRRESALVHAVQDWSTERRRARYVAQTSLTGPLREPVTWDDLTAAEQRQYGIGAAHLESYVREIRQIHAILDLDHVQGLFVLQPHIILTRKPMAGTEPRLRELTHRREGNLYVYGIATLYPKLADALEADGAVAGYRFANLIDTFDTVQTQAFTDYCHLTPEADRVMAERIFDSLSDSFAARAR